MTSRSPLHDAHVECGARFTDFGGWEMPVSYEGTLAEHKSVREAAGVFDVSHLGRFLLEGPGAASLIDSLLCNDLSRIEPGRAQYTMLLDEAGGIIDDIIVWWLEEERFLVLPNGANHARVLAEFTGHDRANATDIRPQSALLAIQGPTAPGIIEEVFGNTPRRFRTLASEDGTATMAGTGYTGERGGEIMVDVDSARSAWDALLRAGVTPCGLAARDTLRLEMGYPLWGQDLDESTTPLEADLEWVVGWDSNFRGKKALTRQRDQGFERQLIGFRFDDRRVPRPGHPLRYGDGGGAVTSGNFSPVLQVGIGLGYLSPPPGDGAQPVEVEIRGEWHPATRVDPPFLER